MSETKSVHSEEDTIPFYPDHITTEAKVVIVMVVIAFVVGIIGMIAPLGVGDPADPMVTPSHVKPEWYFLALYQLLKFIPKTTGVLIPVLGVFLVLIWPFLDNKPEKSKKPTKIRLIVSIIGLIIIIALTIWGELG